MFIVTYRKIFYTLSALIAALAVGAVLFFGVTFSIDFTGGAITEVSYTEGRPDKSNVESALSELSLGGFSLRPSGDNAYILRTKDLSEEERQAVLAVLKGQSEGEVREDRYSSIGPVIGEELRNKAFVAIAFVIVLIVLFVAFAFRKVSDTRLPQGTRGVSSWKYGIIAIIALIHDVIIPVGVFAVLGHFFGAEIDVLFVMALLAILGYSINDTIVVFDRVRENLRINNEKNVREDFELTVGKSLDQTFTRSVNTSLTTLFVLLALFFLGASVTENFALVLLTGVIAGTYSSICLATPLLVTVEQWSSRKTR